MRSGITRRWLRGNLLITVLVVLLAEAMFLYSYTRSYYGSVQQIMYRRFSSVTGQLKMYTGDTAQSAAASRSLALRRMVEQFADKDKYEFMLLDSYGGVIASSSGTDAEGIVSSKDFEQALNGPDGLGVAVYRTQSGEVVMAACSLVPYDAEDVAALRLVTSLALVERQVKNAIIISVFLAVAILLFTIMSGLYFVRGIVVPLGQVERTAAGIARGELDVRLPLTGDPHDEVDRLRGTINQMAEGLEETEKMKNEFISSVSHRRELPQGAGDHQQRDRAAEQYGGGAAGFQPPAERTHPHGVPPAGLGGRTDRCGALLRSTHPAGGAAAPLHRAGGDDPCLRRPGPSAAGVHQYSG